MSVLRWRVGSCERLALRDSATGRVIPLRPDGAAEGDVPSPPRHEAILEIARTARWRVASVLLVRQEDDLGARIALVSDEARIVLEARPGSALRLSLAAGCPVAIEDAAWSELVRRADPIPRGRAAELADEILRALDGEGPRNEVA